MRLLNLLRVVGARPQFMQIKPLREQLLARGHNEVILHTGQHYDDKMSKKFFIDLDLPLADINLAVGSGSHGFQTAEMLKGIESELLKNKYDAVVVDGDTNSTLAGALAGSKLHIPVVHIESGMRSYNKNMPEEINRVLTDHVSTLLFCPSAHNRENLKSEWITKGVHVVGDVLTECFYGYKGKAVGAADSLLSKYGLNKDGYILLTMHRAENLLNIERLKTYLEMISSSPYPVLWPMHPHSLKIIAEKGMEDIIKNSPFKIIEPVGYIEMLALEYASKKILTDSGGVQREAYHWGKPCCILRQQTEWVEIIDSGLAKLVTGDGHVDLWDFNRDDNNGFLYGSDGVSKKIVNVMEEEL